MSNGERARRNPGDERRGKGGERESAGKGAGEEGERCDKVRGEQWRRGRQIGLTAVGPWSPRGVRRARCIQLYGINARRCTRARRCVEV